MQIGLLLWVSGVLVVIASIFTIFVLRHEDKKRKQYASDENIVQEELRRSQEYEENSISKYIPIQLWMYAIGAVFTILLVLYFMI